AGAMVARADGVAQGLGEAAGAGQATTKGDGVSAAPAQAIGSDASIEPPPPPPAPAVVSQPGYKHNPRTARDLDPLPPSGEDLAELVRDKWDAIERADAAIKRARGGDAPAQAAVPTPAPAPAPRPSKRPAGAIAAAGLPLTEEQMRADEEAFILMVAEIL
ncbi:hypothetical protein EG878_17425, partial [Enterococcus faecalis]